MRSESRRDGIPCHTHTSTTSCTWCSARANVGPKPEPERRPGDPNVRALERELEGRLGMRVRIQDRGGRGKITFEYGSLEQFDSVVERLKR